LFVLPWSLHAIGGVNQVVMHLAKQMQDAGKFTPFILVDDWDARKPVLEEVDGIRTVRWRLRAYRRGMPIKEKLAYFFWERQFRADFSRFCSVQSIKAVNVHYPGWTAFAIDRVLSSLTRKIPLLLSFHGTDVNELTDLSEEQKGEWRDLTGRAHATVACSNHLAQRLRHALGADLACQVIYNGVDAKKFVRPPVAPGHAGKIIILHVGKFDANKGQHVLIEAFSRIASDFPSATLQLVGGRGEHLNSLRRLAAEKGLAERIEFFVDIPPLEMFAYFCRAQVFALPSRQEGFPLVLLEAGASGLAVVASRVGGVPELIDAETGILVEPDDPAALAETLLGLLHDPAAAQQLGDRLQRRVFENFSWTQVRQHYEALIDDGGDQGRVSPPRLQASRATHLI
jgi:glycosyltransferase involved in cell wall biosynthesis